MNLMLKKFWETKKLKKCLSSGLMSNFAKKRASWKQKGRMT